MKGILNKKLSGLKNKGEKYNFLREFLQELILHILDRNKYFRNLAFVGGTALRVIYDLPRFSEDLGFSLVNKKDYAFEKLLSGLNKELGLNGFEADISSSTGRTVHSSFIKFKGILHELKVSPHASEKISIKLEIDTNPPPGYSTEVSLINRDFLFKVVHYDQASLFAGKLHAFLFRKYAKARDFYDFLWFLTRKNPINYKLLNAAAKQTQHKDFHLKPDSLKQMLINKVEHVNFKSIQTDLLPFLINAHEVEFFTLENFIAAIEKEFQ